MNRLKTPLLALALGGLLALPMACGAPTGDVQVREHSSRPLALVEADAADALEDAVDVAAAAELLRLEFEDAAFDVEAAAAEVRIRAGEVSVRVGELSVDVQALAASGACDCEESVSVIGPAGSAFVDGCGVRVETDDATVEVSSCVDLVVALDAAVDFSDFSIDISDAVDAAFGACAEAEADLDEAGLTGDCDFFEIDPNLPAEAIAELEDARAESCDAAAEAIAACDEAVSAVSEAAEALADASAEIEAELEDFEAELAEDLAALEQELEDEAAALEAELAALEEELAAADEEARAEAEAALAEAEAALAEAEAALAEAEQAAADAESESSEDFFDDCFFSEEGCDEEEAGA